MILLQALIASLSLLLCVLVATAVPVPAALTRGLVSNLVLFWLLFAAVALLRRPGLRAVPLALIALGLAAVQAHILINGAYPQVVHAGLAADRGFLASLLADRVILLLIPVNLVWVLLTGLPGQMRRLPAPRLGLLLTVATVLLAFLFMTAWLIPGINAHWYARSLVEHQLLGRVALADTGAGLTDGRMLVPPINGKPIQSLTPPRHVLLIFIEGLSAHYVAAGATPEIAVLEPEGLLIPRFVAHQRQTHRGLFAALCGAYPNLIRREAKSDLMGMAGLRQRCLPATLRDAGWDTVFLQSADLGFMAKDLFAEAAGFARVAGQQELGPGPADGPWGLDDRTLMERAYAALKQQGDRPSLTALLTSGTHPPFHTLVSDNDQAQAFAFASAAVGWLVERLKHDGLLDDTLLLITSDEASVGGDRVLDGIPAANRGYMLLLGAGIRPGRQPGLFGQVDIPVTVLDALGLPREGFGGASMLRRVSGPRTLLAANGYRGELYLIREGALVRCDGALDCVGQDGNAVSVEGLADMVSLNDLSRVGGSDTLAHLGKRRYAGNRVNTILGRYVTQQPKGTGLRIDLRADNSGGSERPLRLLLWDCRGDDPAEIALDLKLPAGGHRLRAGFRFVQSFDEQCHQLFAYPMAGAEGSDWTLKGLELSLDRDLDAAVSSLRSARATAATPALRRIAHAGVALSEKTDTDPIAALDAHWARGLRWFQLDFQWTADGQLVCDPDFGLSSERNLGATRTGAPTPVDFEVQAAGQPVAPCTPSALAAWLDAHPGARIVTDFNERAMDGLAVLMRAIPEPELRLIAQIDNPAEEAAVRALGLRDTIWTLRRFPGDTPAVIEALAGMSSLAVTMNEQRLLFGLGLVLARASVPVYVETVNDSQQAERWRTRWGATAFYTNHLSPGALEPVGP